jgi:flagellar motility protein MotE (MotC chaperone)
MSLDYATLTNLRKNHPAWRLLLADHAPLIATFLQQVFIAPNVRLISQADLVSKLEDQLFQLRETLGEGAFPKTAIQYLDDWAQNDKGWMRKFYPVDSDEPHFDLTPATEKVIGWLESLTQRAFVGTESRLMTVFELLKQIAEGSETDPQLRIAELEKRKAEIDDEISRIHRGDLDILDETSLKDRFQQLIGIARELLTDFREVEQNFRDLDHSVREKIALWEGAKGELLEQIFGKRDVITDSDQGKSFRAFWDFLMSPSRQDELSALLETVLALPVITGLSPDRRLKRIHYDWLEAGEHTQRTVAQLSQQLRRYLDDQAYLENRRIMNVLHGIETKTLALRESQPQGAFVEIDASSPGIQLPMERPLYSPPLKPVINDAILPGEDESLDTDILFDQVVVDKARLEGELRKALQQRPQVTLAELIDYCPLEQGLAELLTWLSLASQDHKTLFDESHRDSLFWTDSNGGVRNVRLPRIIFNR